ncbi:hypothetical protein J132_06373 [Termitomyces sp. J132]|nr:hypothetical protein H2248_000144 [Termitomyces sp. 'cryptogamus']KNZ74738.1 hypothetical protein J132_06373 [Termitomyces sp. J132]
MAGVLDVEDPCQRFDRLQNTLERLNDTKSAPNHTFSFLSADSTKPHFIPPPNDLLSRVQAFLPALEASNALLSSQDPTRIDIEHIDAAGPYIEMNLGLGLFDVRGTTPSNASLPTAPVFPLSKSPSASSESSTATATTSYSSSSDDYWDSDEDSDAEIIITSFKPVRPVRPLPRRAMRQVQAMQGRPSIVVLSERSADSDCGPRNGEEG